MGWQDDPIVVAPSAKAPWENDPVVDASPAQPTGTPYEQHGIMGALLPSRVGGKPGAGPVARAVADVGDVLTLPVRTLGGIAAGAGTLAGGGSWRDAATNDLNEMSRTSANAQDKATGLGGLVENVALDPATYLPAGKLLEGSKLLAKAPTLVKGIVKSGVMGGEQGALSGAYQQANNGNVDLGETAAQTGIGAGLGALASGVPGLAMKGLGNLSKDFAKRNVAIELRGGQTGRKQGLDVENALKHDIVGTPREMATIGQSKLNDLNAKAKAIGANSDEAVNVPSLLDAVKGNFSRQKNVHDYDDIISFIDDLDAKYRKAYPSADISLPDAMQLRTQIGDKAQFVNGGFDPDADWKSQVYNGLYDEIKDQVHAKGGPELQAINRAQSEIIPVVNAAKRRMPIAESNNRVSLADLLTTGVGAHVAGAGLGAATGAALPGDRLKNSLEGAALGAGLAGVRRLAGSPAVTKALYGLGSKLSPTLERPLNELNPADYPTGKQWPEVPPKNPPNGDFNYGPAARHTPPPDSPPANMELPATVDQYDDQQKFLKSLKSELWQKIPDKTDRDLLLGNVTRDKKGNLLHLSVQAENALQDAVDAIRENPEWHSDITNIGFEVPEHIDDVKSWLSSIGNEPAAGKPRLPLAGLGDDSFLGRTLGNERGAVGAAAENPQIHTDNFKNWFGDWQKAPEQASKVVDESGKPLVVYHGTGADFSKFSKSKIGSGSGEGSSEKAFFFSKDPDVSSKYALVNTPDGGYNGANVKPAYLSIKNPYYSDLEYYNSKDVSQEIEKAKKAGYDGVIFDKMKGGRERQQIAAFSPSQIKSATGNSGAFSSANPDIRGSGAIPLMATGAGLGALGLGGYGALKGLSDKYRSFRSGNNQQGGSP